MLTAEQRTSLDAALSKDRLRTLSKLVSEIARQCVRPEVQERTRERFFVQMRPADPAQRKKLMKDGFRPSKMVSELGEAMISKRLMTQDIIDRVEALEEADSLDSDGIERVCTVILN